MAKSRAISPVPLYGHVKQYILGRITSGAWPAGTRLPSENDLVAKFGVSRMTVHRAVRELSDKGLVNRIVGVGAFVAYVSFGDFHLLCMRDSANHLMILAPHLPSVEVKT